MNKKKYTNFILVIVLLISIFGLNLTITKINGNNKKLSCFKIDSIPYSLSELTQDSDSVVLGIPEEDPTIIEYGGVTFYLTKINVQENYCGNELESFTLLQTYSNEDPIVSSNEPFVLFLSKYSGPIIDDSTVYVCTSLGYGQYSLQNNNIIPALNDSNSNRIINDYQTLNGLETALYDITSLRSSN